MGKNSRTATNLQVYKNFSEKLWKHLKARILHYLNDVIYKKSSNFYRKIILMDLKGKIFVSRIIREWSSHQIQKNNWMKNLWYFLIKNFCPINSDRIYKNGYWVLRLEKIVIYKLGS